MLVLLTTADTEILAAAHAVRELPDGFAAGALREPDGVDRRRRLPRRAARRRARGRGPAARRAARVAGGRRRAARALRARRRRAAAARRRGRARRRAGRAVAARRRATWRRRSSTCATAASRTRANLLRFLADTLLLDGHGFAPPRALPDLGVYVPGPRRRRARRGARGPRSRPADGRPRLLPLAPGDRQHRVRRRAGGGDRARRRPTRCACGPTRCARTPTGACPALELLDGRGRRARHDRAGLRRLDGADAAVEGHGTGASGARTRWPASASRSSRRCARRRAARAGRRRDAGLTPLDAAMQVAIPEFDGRIVGVPVSFKEPLDGVEPPSAARCCTTRRTASAATRLAAAGGRPRAPAAARAGARPAHRDRALELPDQARAAIGNAVGLDTPASAMALLDALARGRLRRASTTSPTATR